MSPEAERQLQEVLDAQDDHLERLYQEMVRLQKKKHWTSLTINEQQRLNDIEQLF